MRRHHKGKDTAMAYIAYPIAKAHPPYGDIYHDHLPVLVTTVAEYEEMLGQRRQDFGCGSCNDADPLVITLGRSRCGVWLEAEVLLDTLPRPAEELIGAFDLEGDWFWDWEQDYSGAAPPDQAAMQAPHQVRQ
jgi:hypothetical protein